MNKKPKSSMRITIYRVAKHFFQIYPGFLNFFKVFKSTNFLVYFEIQFMSKAKNYAK